MVTDELNELLSRIIDEEFNKKMFKKAEEAGHAGFVYFRDVMIELYDRLGIVINLPEDLFLEEIHEWKES